MLLPKPGVTAVRRRCASRSAQTSLNSLAHRMPSLASCQKVALQASSVSGRYGCYLADQARRMPDRPGRQKHGADLGAGKHLQWVGHAPLYLLQGERQHVHHAVWLQTDRVEVECEARLHGPGQSHRRNRGTFGASLCSQSQPDQCDDVEREAHPCVIHVDCLVFAQLAQRRSEVKRLQLDQREALSARQATLLELSHRQQHAGIRHTLSLPICGWFQGLFIQQAALLEHPCCHLHSGTGSIYCWYLLGIWG